MDKRLLAVPIAIKFLFALTLLFPMGVVKVRAASIAIGYNYTVTNADFATIQAPSFATISDPDGYSVSFSFSGMNFNEPLASGATLTFAAFNVGGTPVSDVQAFSLSGIDPSLMLDPNNPLAFPLGVSLTDITGGPSIAQTPITVPEPNTSFLICGGILSLGIRRRRRRSASK